MQFDVVQTRLENMTQELPTDYITINKINVKLADGNFDIPIKYMNTMSSTNSLFYWIGRVFVGLKIKRSQSFDVKTVYQYKNVL